MGGACPAGATRIRTLHSARVRRVTVSVGRPGTRRTHRLRLPVGAGRPRQARGERDPACRVPAARIGPLSASRSGDLPGRRPGRERGAEHALVRPRSAVHLGGARPHPPGPAGRRPLRTAAGVPGLPGPENGAAETRSGPPTKRSGGRWTRCCPASAPSRKTASM